MRRRAPAQRVEEHADAVGLGGQRPWVDHLACRDHVDDPVGRYIPEHRKVVYVWPVFGEFRTPAAGHRHRRRVAVGPISVDRDTTAVAYQSGRIGHSAKDNPDIAKLHSTIPAQSAESWKA